MRSAFDPWRGGSPDRCPQTPEQRVRTLARAQAKRERKARAWTLQLELTAYGRLHWFPVGLARWRIWVFVQNK